MRTVHQQQAGSGPDEVLSIWCDHIDKLLPDDETTSTQDKEATIAAQLESTIAAQLEAAAEMKAQAEGLEANEEASTEMQA